MKKNNDVVGRFRVVGDMRYIEDIEILSCVSNGILFRELWSKRIMSVGEEQLNERESVYRQVVKQVEALDNG